MTLDLQGVGSTSAHPPRPVADVLLLALELSGQDMTVVNAANGPGYLDVRGTWMVYYVPSRAATEEQATFSITTFRTSAATLGRLWRSH